MLLPLDKHQGYGFFGIFYYTFDVPIFIIHNGRLTFEELFIVIEA